MSIIKPEVACRTQNELEHKAFEAVCVASNHPIHKIYSNTVMFFNGKLSYLSGQDFYGYDNVVELEDILFCPDICPKWVIDVRVMRKREIIWTNGKNRSLVIGEDTQPAVHYNLEECKVIAKRKEEPYAKQQENKQ